MIEEADLKRNLQSLACAKYKVLKKHPAGREINNDDSFSFNVDFTDKMQRIKISTVSSRPENNQERQETQGKIDEERKHQMDVSRPPNVLHLHRLTIPCRLVLCGL